MLWKNNILVGHYELVTGGAMHVANRVPRSMTMLKKVKCQEDLISLLLHDLCPVTDCGQGDDLAVLLNISRGKPGHPHDYAVLLVGLCESQK